MGLSDFLHRLSRTKKIDANLMDTQMSRCLTTFDITLLGIGHTSGAGIYVLTGTIVKNVAGPGIVVSFILAGLASTLSALCYAEFGSRVPKAGSAYVYSYVTVGELWAFIIGWNIILEHMVGSAAVARSWSGYLDSLLGGRIRNETIDYVGRIDSSIFGDYPDFVAFLVVVMVAVFMGLGAKCSTRFNTVFTCVNMVVITFVIVLGFTRADTKYWTDKEYGGFTPYGASGVLAGAASCFFAYIGFDSIATSGEEAADPSRSIPRATFISMSLVTLEYVLVSTALTMMLPYQQVHPSAAFADAFEQHGLHWAKHVVAIGALSGMTTSLVGGLFALPRCVYAMANDGLIFRFLSHIHPRTQVPTLAALVFGAITAVIALLFDIETLVEFLSIGTLLAYTIVSSSVIIMRYRPSSRAEAAVASKLSSLEALHQQKGTSCGGDSSDTGSADSVGLMDDDEQAGRIRADWLRTKQYFGHFPPGRVVTASVAFMIVCSICLAAVATHGKLAHGSWYGIVLTIVFSALIVCSLVLIAAHEQSRSQLRFRVPFVPYLPAISNVVNIVLMFQLAPLTWLRLAIWLWVGFLVYFLYGIRNSSENQPLERWSLVPSTVDFTAANSLAADATVSIERPQVGEK